LHPFFLFEKTPSPFPSSPASCFYFFYFSFYFYIYFFSAGPSTETPPTPSPSPASLHIVILSSVVRIIEPITSLNSTHPHSYPTQPLEWTGLDWTVSLRYGYTRIHPSTILITTSTSTEGSQRATRAYRRRITSAASANKEHTEANTPDCEIIISRPRLILIPILDSRFSTLDSQLSTFGPLTHFVSDGNRPKQKKTPHPTLPYSALPCPPLPYPAYISNRGSQSVSLSHP
jgi:hypothetical protein